MGGRGLIRSFTFILFLGSVSTGPKRWHRPVKELNTILDLKGIDFGQSFPRGGFVLLYWLSNTIEIDNNDIIHLDFEPNRGDYGSHYYGNFEGLLDALPTECSRQINNRQVSVSYNYYSLGNLYRSNNHRALPRYFTRIVNLRGNQNNNRVRIIFRIQQFHYLNGVTQRAIDQVYFTQHYPDHRRSYDPDNTYRGTTNLLRELQALSLRDIRSIIPREIQEQYNSDIDQPFLDHLINVWGELSGLGLLLGIVLSRCGAMRFGQQFLSSSVTQLPSSSVPHLCLGVLGTGAVSHCDNKDDDDVLLMKLEVKTTSKGKARICWSDIPSRFPNQSLVVLYKNNEDDKSSIYSAVNSQDGCFDTSVPLNPGLQVRLHKAVTRWFRSATVGEEIWRGPEFHDANGELPVYIPDHDASLQLFVKDGMACARLYVMKKFTDWKTKFKNSWVGFYSDEKKAMSGYSTWQWAISFTRENRSDWKDIPDYDVFVYHSKMAIAPGVQARFILQKNDKVPVVHTSPWHRLKLKVKTTSKGKARICWSDNPSRFPNQSFVVLYKNNEDNESSIYSAANSLDGCFDTSVPLNPGLQVRLHKAVTHWFRSATVGEEIWRGPEFHDANGELPVYIPDHDASLQLFVKDGMACARLYVMKKFTDWKTKFKNSWVGFYSDEKKAMSGYSTWQWAISFTSENRSDRADIPDYDVFVYHSKMAIAPGVQARFMLKRYDNVPLVHTPPWDNLMAGTGRPLPQLV